MYQPMDYYQDEWGHTYQRALRSPMKTLEQAMRWATKRAQGKPFVCCGVTVVWSK
jgi:hypothetical protein